MVAVEEQKGKKEMNCNGGGGQNMSCVIGCGQDFGQLKSLTQGLISCPVLKG